MKIKLIYGSDTGNTEYVIENNLLGIFESHFEIESLPINQVTPVDWNSHNFYILGVPTWYDGELQNDWEDYFDKFKTIDFTGKKVALFGLGDQIGYGEWYCDGIGILAQVVEKNGGNIIGFTEKDDSYEFESSKALFDENTFWGLALDEDNQDDLTEERLKLINILSHDVQRIERLITDYSQMLKDEVALSKEQFKKFDIFPIIQSVVDDYNNLYQVKRGINISCNNDGSKNYDISGIENRIEQIIANLLDNAISFSEDNKNIEVKISKNTNKQVVINIIDEGQGFKEKDTSKIFKRFYSNRPDKFGQHSGLGLNIVKNLVELHKGSINASNRHQKKGANIEIIFPNS